MNRGRILVVAVVLASIAIFSLTLSGQPDSGWRISPEKINLQPGQDRALQILDDSAQELRGAEWSIDHATLAAIETEDGRAVLHPKAPGTVRVTATLHGQTRSQDIKIWPSEDAIPLGTTTWGNHAIGRELGDLAAVPTPDGPNTYALEQTADGRTYLRAIREDGIQIWNWHLPEDTRSVDLVCGDFLGGALISANRADSYTLYTVGGDGKIRWQQKLPGIRKAHAYNLEHLIHVLSQSPDGSVTTLTGLDEMTGQRKFNLTLPASHVKLTNVQKIGTKLQCIPKPVESPVRTLTSRLFVNIDGMAYVAFTENDWTLSTASCTPGSTLESRNVSFDRKEKVVLWQIHPDGTYRSTIVEQFNGIRPLSERLNTASPTGDIIPDGLGGVLLSVRKTPGQLSDDVTGPTDEFVYRLNPEGDVVYKLLMPGHEGKLHDAMLLGQDNILGLATRGNILIAFSVEDGTEKWRWNSPQEIEVIAALANGGCLVQTPTAVVEVDDAHTAREVMQGKVMIDWLGHMYRKHN